MNVPSAERPIRVLIVDDHPIARMGLCSLLKQHTRVIAVGQAADGQEALTKARELRPDVVLLDLDLPKMDGWAVTQILRKEEPEIKVLVISGYNQGHLGGRIEESGAHGFISKEASARELLQAIEIVASGAMCFCATEPVELAANRAGMDRLSAREHEVAMALVEGLTNDEVATRLGLSVRTVESHRNRIMSKLDIRGVADLTKLAIQHGLISL